MSAPVKKQLKRRRAVHRIAPFLFYAAGIGFTLLPEVFAPAFFPLPQSYSP
jgi:hypothetical protein